PYFKVKPTGEFAGKFGYEYPVACAILDGAVIKKTFSDEAFNRADLKRHLGKFKTVEDPASATTQGPLGALVIEAKGKTTVQPIEIPLGDAKRPVPPAQVVEKYVRNAGEVVGTEVARRTAQMLLDIENLSSIRPLLDQLAKRS
ncbi:MAG TPA: hypothetical protein VK642_14460, partial [Burkholderiales bacterium]|nr:hypothetical protein [Burkholderiales bacterium]